MPLQIEDALSSLSFLQRGPIDLSPDGQWVAYTLEDPRRKMLIKDDRYTFLTRTGISIFVVGCDVWVTNTASGQSKCLTGGEGSSWGPVWSLDGNHLIFYSDRDGQARLWRWDKATDTLQRVSDITVRPYFGDEVVRWTPDSRKVLCKVIPEGMTLEDTLDLIVGPPKAADDEKMDSQSSALIYRSPIASEQDHCAEEPQENTLDADVTNLYLADLALIDVSSGNVERAVCREKVTGYWLSPDATKVAFTVLTEKAYDIAVVSLSDLCTRVVASDVQNEQKFSVSWSPEGDLLSYTSEGDCLIASIGGEGPQNLTSASHLSFANVYRAPLWDALGENLYLLASDTLCRISIADSSVNAVTQIPNRRLMEVVSPASGGRFWSPEGGKSLYLITRIDKTKKIEFYKVNLSTGKFNRLMEAEANCGSPAILTIDVSDDNQRVIYTRQDAQRCEDIWIADVDFQNPRQLTHVNPVDDTVVMGTGRLINWRSLDGEELYGALLLPANYEPGK